MGDKDRFCTDDPVQNAFAKAESEARQAGGASLARTILEILVGPNAGKGSSDVVELAIEEADRARQERNYWQARAEAAERERDDACRLLERFLRNPSAVYPDGYHNHVDAANFINSLRPKPAQGGGEPGPTVDDVREVYERALGEREQPTPPDWREVVAGALEAAACKLEAHSRPVVDTASWKAAGGFRLAARALRGEGDT